MKAHRRQEKILKDLARQGRVSVIELAATHKVTVETIRRDLTALDQAGALRKIRGGAVVAPALATPETGVTQREITHAEAKARIASAALAALDLRPGATLLIDSGTTTGAFARFLPDDLDLLVLTNSVLIAATLAPRPGCQVRIIGGHVRGLTQAAVGPEALLQLASLRADYAILGSNGLTAQHGLSTPDPDEAAVKRAMVSAGRRVAALIDASKIGQEHLISFADTDNVDLLVTDAVITGSLATHLHDSGCEVIPA
ncbi:MAG: DeoR/GlpR family DNA-binding transcription regulator [Actinomycetaceae bacterium]|nr:DeoR/GlpR family DNA-binding transcription regulator [Actinomycetaceae bacterium]